MVGEGMCKLGKFLFNPEEIDNEDCKNKIYGTSS